MEMFCVILISSMMHAIGSSSCSDLIPPEDSWLKRNGDVSVIGCYSRRMTWRLYCENGKWVGSLGNCLNGDISEMSSHSEKASNLTDEWRNVLIIVCIAMASLVISVLIITCGIIGFRRVRASNQRKMTKTSRTNTTPSDSQDAFIDSRNENAPPQPPARQTPISHRVLPVTPSIAEINQSTTKAAPIAARNRTKASVDYKVIPLSVKPESAFHSVVRNESHEEPTCTCNYMDRAGERFRRRTKVRFKESNSTFGNLLANEFRSQSQQQEYRGLIEHNTNHPEAGYLVPDEFKHLSRAHDYLDLVDCPTLPRGTPYDSKHRYLLPNEFRSQSRRRHEYLHLIDHDPNQSSFRRCQSDSYLEYLEPNEFSQQVYANDYMDLVERESGRPTVYAFLRSPSATTSMQKN